MGRNDPVEDFVRALSDKRVQDLLGDIFDDKLKSLIQEVENMKKDNVALTTKVNNLEDQLTAANQKIDELELYNRRDNLIISGLPLQNAAEAVTTATPENRSRNVECLSRVPEAGADWTTWLHGTCPVSRLVRRPGGPPRQMLK